MFSYELFGKYNYYIIYVKFSYYIIKLTIWISKRLVKEIVYGVWKMH